MAISIGDLSDYEMTVINNLPGGADLLSKVSDASPEKCKSLMQEAKIVLDAIQRGEVIEAIGKSVPREGKKEGDLTEIDVETDHEIIQVKGGNYANQKKLEDENLRQMIETKRYRDRSSKLPYVNLEDNELPAKIKKVVFHFVNPPVDPRLIEWLTRKGVEPRVGL